MFPHTQQPSRRVNGPDIPSAPINLRWRPGSIRSHVLSVQPVRVRHPAYPSRYDETAHAGHATSPAKHHSLGLHNPTGINSTNAKCRNACREPPCVANPPSSAGKRAPTDRRHFETTAAMAVLPAAQKPVSDICPKAIVTGVVTANLGFRAAPAILVSHSAPPIPMFSTTVL